jgi:hypothetical protein
MDIRYIYNVYPFALRFSIVVTGFIDESVFLMPVPKKTILSFNMKYDFLATLDNEEPKENKNSDKTFVGGTKFDDQHASIGMEFENQDKTLTFII